MGKTYILYPIYYLGVRGDHDAPMDLNPNNPSPRRIHASQVVEYIPESWYNILPDLPEPVPPMLNSDGKPIPREALERIFGKELVRQEYSMKRYVEILEDVRNTLIEIGRPTPLFRAYRLEKRLNTRVRIYYKYEGVLPTGSHKINTAIAQAYYNSIQGVERLVTETGAGQWGSALALAGSLFGLKVRVYMVKISYLQKPYRRVMIKLYGGEVYPSPSDKTEIGRKILCEDPDHPGTLGIAIAEAIEDTLKNPDTRYCLGSVLNHVLLHQTIIGLEAKKQLEELGEYPDYVVGCVGGGSNFAGLLYPFTYDKPRKNIETVFIAVEPRASPSMTRGKYMYDYGDSAGLTPLLKMHTLGHKYRVPPIHAGGLRYHGVAPTLSILINHGIVNPIAYHQSEVSVAAKLFAETEGIIPAPESAHAVKAVIDLARKLRNEEVTILFNMSGHGLLDLKGFEEFLEGKLIDYEPSDRELSI